MVINSIESNNQPAGVKAPLSPFAPKPLNHPISGLDSAHLMTSLRNIGVYVVDVETTGLQRSDKMFSAAYTKMDIKHNTSSPIETKESFFNVIRRPKLSDYQSTPTAFVDEIEQRLARAHSSQVFGDKQLQAGSLREAAQAIADDKAVKPAGFLKEFTGAIGGEANGSLVLSHNSQFENNQFEKLNGSTSKVYDKAYQQAKAANVGNQGLFGANKEISNWSNEDGQEGITQRIRKAYNSYAEAVKGNTNPALVKQALGEYAVENKNLMNHMIGQINDISGQAGKYTNLDTMPMVKALMSFGAVNGDVDKGNLLLGGKIEHLGMAWFGEVESHTAGGDTKLQGKISQVIFKELEEFGRDPNYRSSRLLQLNQYINDNNVATNTFKSSIVSEVSSTSKYKTKAEYISGVYDWIDSSLERYSIASGSQDERVGIANKVKVHFDETLKTKPNASSETIAREMESWIKNLESTTDTQKAGRVVMSDIAAQGKSFLKAHKNKFALAGAALAGSMFIDGSEKGEDKKYNTYDELYNNQYYGTGFADWQNRNNAHRVLY